jgi:Holliday junction resolvase-like predicted endonuclease
MLEIGAYDKLKEIIIRDYDTYSGHVLEEFFRLQLAESGQFTRIGMWHDRRGENEIDIIAADELNKRVEFIEVKRQRRNIDLSILRAKADVFLNTTKKFGKYDINYRGLSLDDI